MLLHRWYQGILTPLPGKVNSFFGLFLSFSQFSKKMAAERKNPGSAAVLCSQAQLGPS